MSTQTLQDLRKQKFKTIKAFSIAYGCSASKAGMILQGRYQSTLSKDEVVQLAALFEVPFETCIAACDASHAEWRANNNGSMSDSDKLKWRWDREEELQKGAEHAAKTGDWSSFFRFSRFEFHSYDAYTGQHWHTSGSAQNNASGDGYIHVHTTPVSSCYSLLGVSQNATEAQIRKAFRDKVKASHDGKGGYTIDMDKLTQAKEQALAELKVRV